MRPGVQYIELESIVRPGVSDAAGDDTLAVNILHFFSIVMRYSHRE